MDKETFLSRIQEIGTCDDDVLRRESLAELSDELSSIFDSLADVTAQNTNLMNDNEQLRSANMKLFLRVGADKTPADIRKNSTGIDDNPAEKLKFEDLFDEKGGLK